MSGRSAGAGRSATSPASPTSPTSVGAPRRCAISIDLDSLDCYYRIHGLGPSAPAALAGVVLERALPRAVALLARHELVATWFVVGADVDGREDAEDPAAEPRAGSPRQRAGFASALRSLAQAGHELGNHSYTHPYDLARLPPAQQREELVRGDGVLRWLQGGAVAGFRSPGYDLSPSLALVLQELGYRYDSSVFPAPPYYVLKAAAMATQRALGRRSGAVLTEPRALAAPRQPYRLDASRPWARGAGPLWELPIAVTPRLRLPVIGTSLLLAPRRLRAALLDAVAADAFFNLELHGLDFADAQLDELPAELVARQPDLRLTLEQKLEALDEIFARVGRDYQAVTLAEQAQALSRDAVGR